MSCHFKSWQSPWHCSPLKAPVYHKWSVAQSVKSKLEEHKRPPPGVESFKASSEQQASSRRHSSVGVQRLLLEVHCYAHPLSLIVEWKVQTYLLNSKQKLTWKHKLAHLGFKFDPNVQKGVLNFRGPVQPFSLLRNPDKKAFIVTGGLHVTSSMEVCC